ncbi:hypothetical protein [Saccharothrix sp. Mg75]|uniref:hypothetical protein n=1 Tax=Saccharothrix sp. Mg75 TaxID=3445357 RepID=UPI003EECA226
MNDTELDEWLRGRDAAFTTRVAREVDVEARLREVLTTAGAVHRHPAPRERGRAFLVKLATAAAAAAVAIVPAWVPGTQVAAPPPPTSTDVAPATPSPATAVTPPEPEHPVPTGGSAGDPVTTGATTALPGGAARDRTAVATRLAQVVTDPAVVPHLVLADVHAGEVVTLVCAATVSGVPWARVWTDGGTGWVEVGSLRGADDEHPPACRPG